MEDFYTVSVFAANERFSCLTLSITRHVNNVILPSVVSTHVFFYCSLNFVVNDSASTNCLSQVSCSFERYNPAGNYMLKANNRNT